VDGPDEHCWTSAKSTTDADVMAKVTTWSSATKAVRMLQQAFRQPLSKAARSVASSSPSNSESNIGGNNNKKPETDVKLTESSHEPSESPQNSSSLNYSKLFSVDYMFTLPPLFLATMLRNEIAVTLLLTHGASPQATDTLHACTPLHLSAACQNVPCSVALLEYGAKVNQTNAYGEAPAHQDWELVSRQAHIVRTFLEGLTAFVVNEEIQAKLNASELRAVDQKGQSFSEYSRAIGARFLRRSRLDSGRSSKISSRSRVGDHQSGRGGGGGGGGRRESIDNEKDSLIECHERTGSVTSFKSRVSFNIRISTSSPPLPSSSDQGGADVVAASNQDGGEEIAMEIVNINPHAYESSACISEKVNIAKYSSST